MAYELWKAKLPHLGSEGGNDKAEPSIEPATTARLDASMSSSERLRPREHTKEQARETKLKDEEEELKRIEAQRLEVADARQKKLYGEALKEFNSNCALLGQDWKEEEPFVGKILQTQLKRAIGGS